MSQQKEIVDAVLLLRDDHRVADVWHSADTIAQLLNVPTALFSKAISKSAEFAHIDVQDGSNNCGIVRFKRQLHFVVVGVEKKVSRHFLFFPQRKRPVFYKDSATWTQIYNNSAHFKLAPHSKNARSIITPATSDVESPPLALPPKKKRWQYHGQKIVSVPFDIFNDKNQRPCSIVKAEPTLKITLQDSERYCKNTISLHSCQSHIYQERERHYQDTMCFHCTKSFWFLPWHTILPLKSTQSTSFDCCAEAIDRMKASIQPRLAMAWN
jgi:hypothetical protein